MQLELAVGIEALERGTSHVEDCGLAVEHVEGSFEFCVECPARFVGRVFCRHGVKVGGLLITVAR